jgi:hypothetical protein
MIKKGKYQQSSEAARGRLPQVNTRVQRGRTHLHCACTGACAMRRAPGGRAWFGAARICCRRTTPPQTGGPPSRSSGRHKHLPIQAMVCESSSWRQGSERQRLRRVRGACEAWHRTRSVAVVALDGATAADGARCGEAEIRTRLGFWTGNPAGIVGRASLILEVGWGEISSCKLPEAQIHDPEARFRYRLLPQNLYGPLGCKPLHRTVSLCSGSRSSRSSASCRRRPPPRPLAGLRR